MIGKVLQSVKKQIRDELGRFHSATEQMRLVAEYSAIQTLMKIQSKLPVTVAFRGDDIVYVKISRKKVVKFDTVKDEVHLLDKKDKEVKKLKFKTTREHAIYKFKVKGHDIILIAHDHNGKDYVTIIDVYKDKYEHYTMAYETIEEFALKLREVIARANAETTT